MIDLNQGGHMKVLSNHLKSLLKIVAISCSFILLIQNYVLADWGIQTLDGQNNILAGRHCSLAVDLDGYLHIVYNTYDGTNTYRSLKYISNKLNTPDTWDSILVDNTSNKDLGLYNSIVIESNDTIHVGYYNLIDGDLKYATSNTWGNWTNSNVDTPDNVGEYTDITVDSSGNVHMSYYKPSDMSLKYAYKPAGGSWTTETVEDLLCNDPTCLVGQYTSIGLDSFGDPHIIYYENNMGYLKHAFITGGSWTTETAVQALAKHYTSMIIDGSNIIHLAFYSTGSGNQMYANSANTGPSGWTPEVAHNSSSDLGMYSSIGLDSDDKVHIAYYDSTEDDLEYTTNKSGLWVNQTVDSSGRVGSFSSLAMDEDKIHIAYYNSSGNDLKYAYYNPAAPFVTSTVPENQAVDVLRNRSLLVAFSEEMNPATLTGNSITLEDDQNNIVNGSIDYDTTSHIAVFTPDSSLAANTTYTLTIGKTVTDMGGIPMVKDIVVNFTTAVTVDSTLPEVEITYPADNSVAVPTNTAIFVLFTEEINPLTLTNTSFSLLQVNASGNVSVSGTVEYNAGNRIAVFTPDDTLNAGENYRATIANSVEDLNGSNLASDYIFNFSTGAGPDNISPNITNVTPGEDAVGALIDNVVTIQFSKPINPLTLTHETFSLSESSPNSINYNWYTLRATLTLNEPFGSSKLYTASALAGIKDFFGNSLDSNKQWVFTTTPGVKSTWPLSHSSNTDPSMTRPIEAVFYGDMDSATINTSTFTMSRNGVTVPATTVTYDINDRTAYLELPSKLTLYSGATYTLTITTGAQDINGVGMEEDYVWEFTTFGEPSGGSGGCFLSSLLK